MLSDLLVPWQTKGWPLHQMQSRMSVHGGSGVAVEGNGEPAKAVFRCDDVCFRKFIVSKEEQRRAVTLSRIKQR